MKILYKSPVISVTAINVISFIILIYSVSNGISLMAVFMPLIGVINGRIIDKGVNINRKQRIIIVVSSLIMLGIFLVCAYWIIRLRAVKIINS